MLLRHYCNFVSITKLRSYFCRSTALKIRVRRPRPLRPTKKECAAAAHLISSRRRPCSTRSRFVCMRVCIRVCMRVCMCGVCVLFGVHMIPPPFFLFPHPPAASKYLQRRQCQSRQSLEVQPAQSRWPSESPPRAAASEQQG